MTIHAVDKNFLLEEIPVLYRDRPAGSESKLNTVSDGVKVLSTIANLNIPKHTADHIPLALSVFISNNSSRTSRNFIRTIGRIIIIDVDAV